MTRHGDETRNSSTLTTTKDNTRSKKEILQKQHLQEGNDAQTLWPSD
jgi:hypothetical protein